jgi:hypothetical protein
MERKKTLQLGQKWPDGSLDNKYWIGMDPMQAGIQHGDGLVMLGRECRSLADLENVASEIREDLDRALEEARRKLRQEPGSRRPA